MGAATATEAASPGSLAARVDALLPQTQCAKCGYPGCAPYAEAVARGAAAINQCPPGGTRLVRRLAALLAREFVPLDPSRGGARRRRVAKIDEPRCIGCTLCIQACPVDAIVGAPGQMHTVVVELCTGCDLCIAPCPVDCIDMVPATGADARWTAPRRRAARERFERRNRRLARERAEAAARSAARRSGGVATTLSAEQKRAAIEAAVARVRARRAATRRSPP